MSTDRKIQHGDIVNIQGRLFRLELYDPVPLYTSRFIPIETVWPETELDGSKMRAEEIITNLPPENTTREGPTVEPSTNGLGVSEGPSKAATRPAAASDGATTGGPATKAKEKPKPRKGKAHDLGDRLDRFTAAHSMTNTDLASKIGISPATLYNVKDGRGAESTRRKVREFLDAAEPEGKGEDQDHSSAGAGGATHAGLSERVVKFLSETGWTRADLAAHAGCDPSSVSAAIDGYIGEKAARKIEAFLDSGTEVKAKTTPGDAEEGEGFDLRRALLADLESKGLKVGGAAAHYGVRQASILAIINCTGTPPLEDTVFNLAAKVPAINAHVDELLARRRDWEKGREAGD